MKKLLIAVAALAVLLAACGGSGAGGVASLEESGQDIVEEDSGDASQPGDEETILDFAACMRDNGVEDFEDPDFNADGSLSFRGGGEFSDVDRETMRTAFEACQSHLEGLAFGPGSGDFTEIEDRLLEFSVCMRDNGFDMPDPDFSDFGPGGGGGRPFGGDGFDPDDPEFQSAFEACDHVFEGFGFGGRGGGPGGGG
jgi:hypothetical protein